MRIKEKRIGDVVVLEFEGRLDSSSLKEMEDKLPGLVDSGEHKILLDFGGLDYINSAGLRVLILAGKQLKRMGGKIVLCSLRDYIQEVFDISGFSSFFPICSNEQEALKEFS